MKRGSHTRSAVVGDRRPLERNLARFLLEERGFVVAAEAATAGDVASAVEQHRPDVVLVHENVALEQAALIPGIRTASPTTRVIVLTTDRSAADAALVVAADSVVEEGPGLKELAAALAPRTGLPPMPPRRVAAAATGPVAVAPRPVHRRAWADRFQGAIAASIIVLAAMLARGAGPNVPVAPQEAPARVYLAAAEETLDTLADQILEATPEEAAELARQLLQERAAALASGADTSALDAHIAALLEPVLDDLAPEVAAALLQVLGSGLIYGDQPPPPGSLPPSPSPSAVPPPPPPSPSPSPAPSPPVVPPSPQTEPAPNPSPSPTESPSPSPTDSPSPSPSESPSPTESPSPSQSPPKTPPPCPSPPPDSPHPCMPSYSLNPDDPADRARASAGAVHVVPPALLLLLFGSGVARRLGVRRDDEL